MPFGSVPNLSTGSIGISLLSCGHAGAEAVAWGQAGPASVTKPRTVVTIRVRAGRAESCIDVLMSDRRQYRICGSDASVHTPVIWVTPTHGYLNDLQCWPMT